MRYVTGSGGWYHLARITVRSAERPRTAAGSIAASTARGAPDGSAQQPEPGHDQQQIGDDGELPIGQMAEHGDAAPGAQK